MKAKRKKKGAVHKAAGWRRVAQLVWRVPLAATASIVRFCRHYPRFSIITFSGIICLAVVWNLVWRIHEFQSHLLPEKIEVETTDESLRTRVAKVAKGTLVEARQAKLTRTDFLANLNARLQHIDTLDGSVVRSGLDGRLQISAQPHAPLFLLEVQEKQRYVISKRMTILGKADPGEHEDLPLIEVPELKAPGRPAPTKEKASKKFAPAINLPWLHHTWRTVQEGLKGTDMGALALETLTWRSTNGFSLRFRRTDAINPTPAPTVAATAPTPAPVVSRPGSMTVVLGEHEVNRKVEKLAQLIRDFSQKNLAPEFVDLNFPDKAIIRMRLSDAGPSSTF